MTDHFICSKSVYSVKSVLWIEANLTPLDWDHKSPSYYWKLWQKCKSYKGEPGYSFAKQCLHTLYGILLLYTPFKHLPYVIIASSCWYEDSKHWRKKIDNWRIFNFVCSNCYLHSLCEVIKIEFILFCCLYSQTMYTHYAS